MRQTRGECFVSGKVSALLELGSGFNPEFTGRENVFMNGAILGLDTRQMQERFEAIADFAEIGDFMDQPVKTYSSGMFMRLAFAVAVNVDPDILLVDEALVGRRPDLSAPLHAPDEQAARGRENNRSGDPRPRRRSRSSATARCCSTTGDCSRTVRPDTVVQKYRALDLRARAPLRRDSRGNSPARRGRHGRAERSDPGRHRHPEHRPPLRQRRCRA